MLIRVMLVKSELTQGDFTIMMEERRYLMKSFEFHERIG